MKLSYNWLKEFVDVKLKPEEMALKMNSVGIGIAGIEHKDNDSIFDLEITPNRGDYLSVIGVARQISAVLNKTVKPLKFNLEEISKPSTPDLINVKIENKKDCIRYSCRIILNVKIGNSPEWLVDKLTSAGIKSVNNVVDATNFVMLELGQPLHAFDYDLLEGKKIIVRRAADKEKIITLDNEEKILNHEILVIADEKKAVAVAGIIGGLKTSITNSTKNILLESACFNPSLIRHGSKKLNVSTDSSYRFERNVDYSAVVIALNYAACIIHKIAGGEIASGAKDVYPEKINPVVIKLRTERVKKILGIEITEKQIEQYLARLQFDVKKQQKNIFKVKVPGFRQEVSREIDLIEEVAQMHGYDKIPSSIPCVNIISAKSRSEENVEEKIRQVLVSEGLNEVVNYGLISSEILEKIEHQGKIKFGDTVKIINPLVREMDLLRPTLFFGLLDVISRNISNDIKNIKIFEIGNVFYSPASPSNQKKKIGIIVTGIKHEKEFGFKSREMDFFDIKGIVEGLFSILKVAQYKYEIPVNSEHLFHPYNQLQIVSKDNEIIGKIGEIRAEVINSIYGIKQRLFFAELDFSGVFNNFIMDNTYETVSKFPAVKRDFAIIIKKDLPASDVVDLIKKKSGDILESIRIFDVYEGPQVPAGFKSFALTVIFRDKSKTLTDDAVKIIEKEIFNSIEQSFGAKIRQ